MTQPFAIRPAAMAAALALCTLASAAPAQEPDELSQLRQEALDLVNAARTEAGLPGLKPGEVLDRVAQDHAEDMLARDYYGHVTPEGETPFDRFTAEGGSRWGVSGENIASCQGCATPPDGARVRAFHDGWMQSPGHRENILSEGFDRFGFGIAGEDGVAYAVQTFAGPGADADGGGAAEPVAPGDAPALALERVNAARTDAGLVPLEADGALDRLAARVLQRMGDDARALPENVFELLPEGSTGWTSLGLRSATLGGSGAALTPDDIAAIVSNMVAPANDDGAQGGGGQGGRAPGGAEASHFGFAAEAAGDGRVSAVAVFAGRG